MSGIESTILKKQADLIGAKLRGGKMPEKRIGSTFTKLEIEYVIGLLEAKKFSIDDEDDQTMVRAMRDRLKDTMKQKEETK